MYNSDYAIVEMHDGMLDVLWYAFICSSHKELEQQAEQGSEKGIFDVMILGTASEIFIIQNWGLVEIFWILKVSLTGHL